MTPETRKAIIERYTGWSENWGLSLAFAVTQSVEKAEQVVAEAIVALTTAAAEAEAEQARTPTPTPGRPPAPLSAISSQRFAAVLWEMANAQAYRGFGADAFFRMPAVARAIVVLKTRALFSRGQIAGIVRVSVEQVDGHLENARLLFSDGRPWLEESPSLHLSAGETGEQHWVPECPQWKATAPRSSEAGPTIQDIFAQYVGNDLDPDTGNRLHSHLIVCSACRTNLSYFKRQYSDWINSVPALDAAPELRRHLTKVAKTALKLKRPRLGGEVSPWPGIRKLMANGQILAMVYGAGLFMAGQLFLHNHPSVARFIKRKLHLQ
ncbi:MAG: hypothetical protein HY075_12145 [Deltaproteobacteria bacterium]|nr:hypothetical protein [Deltaproteobacteria bacterium]